MDGASGYVRENDENGGPWNGNASDGPWNGSAIGGLWNGSAIGGLWSGNVNGGRRDLDSGFYDGPGFDCGGDLGCDSAADFRGGRDSDFCCDSGDGAFHVSESDESGCQIAT